MTLDVVDCKNNKVDTLEVSQDIFGKEMNRQILYDVVRMQLANRRQGTACTKTRSEVRGGGKKPWRQKGTGRARSGTSRSPLWEGGGIVFGPKPRSYNIRLPKKVKAGALKVALSEKISEGKLVVVDQVCVDQPKTKKIVEFIKSLNLVGSVLLVTKGVSDVVLKSVRNLRDVDLLDVCGLNVYDILRHDYLLIDREAVIDLGERL